MERFMDDDMLVEHGKDTTQMWVKYEDCVQEIALTKADAQATIAALQDERDGWVRSREHYYQLWMRATDERDEMRKERDEFESLLTQRTAELERVRGERDRIVEIVGCSKAYLIETLRAVMQVYHEHHQRMEG